MGLTYLVTGANRGIGRGITEALLARPNTTVIAVVRDVEKSAKALRNLTIVEIGSTSEIDALTAVEELKSKYGITKVYVLLSKAGILAQMTPVLKTPAQQIRKYIEANTIGPLLLLQALMPFLERSSAPKFFLISSSIGTLTNMENVPLPFFAYSLSKSAANYLVRKAGLENPRLTTQVYNPGRVQTDMGNYGVMLNGFVKALKTLDESVKGLIALVDFATPDKTATFYDVTGEPTPW